MFAMSGYYEVRSSFKFCELINGLWSLYIYKDYSVKLGKTDTDDDITVFVPNSNEASLIDFVAGIRREAEDFNIVLIY